MENFTITTYTTSKEYAKMMLIGLYKKPGFILGTIGGLYLFATILLNYLGIIRYYSETPWFEIVCAVFILLAPVLIMLIAVKQFSSNPSFASDIQFTFSEQGVNVEGKTFRGQFTWDHITKRKEIGKFLILYHSKNTGNFIKKDRFTTEQLNFIRAKVRKK